MKRKLLVIAIALCNMALSAQNTYHVSPTGDDTAAGTLDAPLASIEKAMELVQPGETIYLHAGTYYPTARIRVPAKATSEQSRIRLHAYGDGEVIIDGSAMTPTSVNEFKMSRCMYFGYDANYWYVKGIIFQNAKDSGVKVEGSYNIFENCIFRDNNDTGLQIGMFKDWAIEETKGFPITGTPEYNPDYTYCRGNKVINCDSYHNYDAVTFDGTDDGGDADGFACKLFSGPGTEFHGCRAWNNSDDNWDLYMVYHPVVIDNCYAWNAAIDKDGNETPGNGNGFKLGGGGSAGGAAFDQSTGAHVVMNCVAFNNTVKGFDQNNAYEGMYLFNNVAWNNEYNYRFPTVFKYGGMRIRNCIGFSARKYNHEFLSSNKEGYQVPDTDYNSWTAIDGCDAVKEGNKVDGTKVYTADHSAQFRSLLESDAKAERQPDGSLPDNDFVRLATGSYFIDAGEAVTHFTPTRFMTADEAAAAGLELITAGAVTIEYNGESADMGAYESGVATKGMLYLVSGTLDQLVYSGDNIEPIVLKWSGAATDVTITGADNLTIEKDTTAKSVTISGTLTESVAVTITTIGGETGATLTATLTVSEIAPATLVCATENASQTLFYDTPIADIVFEYGGGATGITITGLPEGLSYAITDHRLTISGTPVAEGTYVVTATGGMTEKSLSGTIVLEVANRVLTGDWYTIQDSLSNLPADLQGVVSIESSDSYTTKWDPGYKESGSTVPDGCTEGAVNMERGGALVWQLPSLLELKANVHFTGGRYLQVDWQINGEEAHSWTSDKLSKRTLTAWDLMQAAGIEPTDKPITVKFVNPANNSGGIRVYDFYVKVYAESASSAITAPQAMPLTYLVAETALILNRDDVAGIRLYNLNGSVASESICSQVISTAHLQGVYLMQVITRDGKSYVQKIILP